MDPLEESKQTMGSVERAVTNLPGIEGYRAKEMRREADKQVRQNLAERLSEQRNRISGLQNQLLGAGGLHWMDDMEQLVTRYNTLIDRVRTASYGYAGFFDLQRVKEAELDRLAVFDKSLFDHLPALDEAIDGLQKAIAANAGIKEGIQGIIDRLEQVNQTFGRRAEAMRGAE